MTERWRGRAVAVALALSAIAVFFPLARHEFIDFDDAGYVFANPHVRAGLTRDGLVWAFTTDAQSNWTPLSWRRRTGTMPRPDLEPLFVRPVKRFQALKERSR